MKKLSPETNILYASKEWKDKRAVFIEGKSCVWCGSTEKLAVHHTHTTENEYRAIKNKLVRELLFEKMSNGEFKVPENKIQSTRNSFYVDPKYYSKFVKKFSEEIEDLIEQNISEKIPDYKDFSKDCIVLCNRCHYAIHNNMHLCSKCKKKYVKNNYSVCFDCLSNEEKDIIKKKIDVRNEFNKEFERVLWEISHS
ncbi:MAG: hypothetical protein PHV39_00965 [Methanomicrobium sp.]|nr:hypothetical protein [Methanomicrobium sp.]